MPTDLTLTPLSGTVQTPIGEKPANGRLFLALRQPDREGDTTVAPHVVDILLDANGAFSQAIWACQLGIVGQAYAAWVTWFSVVDGVEKTASLGFVVVPDLPSANLADLWVADAPAFLPAEVLAQCIAAAVASQANANQTALDRAAAELARADTVAVAASVSDQTLIGVAFTGDGVAASFVFPGLYPSKNNMLVNVGGVQQPTSHFSIVVGATTTTVTLAGPVPINVLVDARVSKRLVSAVTDMATSARSLVRLTAGGTANAITLNSTANISDPPPTDMQVRFRAAVTNSGAATIALDGGTARPCVTVTDVALPAGYIRADKITIATFDGTNWVLNRTVEGGVNANGRFIRREDGTQTCHFPVVAGAPSTADGSAFKSASATNITYPAAFATGTIPAINGSDTGIGSTTTMAPFGANNTTAALRAARPTTTASAPTFSAKADGFWY